MVQIKTPGVDITETNPFPNSVTSVATAIPAFIGYIEKAFKENGMKKFLPQNLFFIMTYKEEICIQN
jgi:phage tail sheath protein FI